MKELIPIINMPNSCLLFIAPTAWGKTSLIIDLFKETNINYLYLSPLRAISEEFFFRVESEFENSYLLRSRKDSNSIFLKNKIVSPSIVVGTPELISYKILEKLGDEWIVLFDEFHLFYHWGDSFRPILEDIYISIANLNINFIAMTATFDLNYFERWKRDIRLSYDNVFIFNLGNHCLKKMPDVQFSIPLVMKKIFLDYFKLILELPKQGGVLFFSKYRQEVDYWLNYCSEIGVEAIGCKGGESSDFQVKYNKSGSNIVFSTSVLSHGVNLKSIKYIFISYPINNLDFWVQMVGRAGRNGEKFWLFTFDQYYTSRRQRTTALFRWFFHYIYLLIKYYLWLLK